MDETVAQWHEGVQRLCAIAGGALTGVSVVLCQLHRDVRLTSVTSRNRSESWEIRARHAAKACRLKALPDGGIGNLLLLNYIRFKVSLEGSRLCRQCLSQSHTNRKAGLPRLKPFHGLV